MEWPSPQPVYASNGPTLKCQVATAGAVYWSWPLKLGRWSSETRGVPARTCPIPREVRATTPAEESGTGMADAVVVHIIFPDTDERENAINQSQN